MNSQQVRLDLIAGFCARLFPTAVRLFIDENRTEGIVVFLRQRTEKRVVLSASEDDLIPRRLIVFSFLRMENTAVEIHLPNERVNGRSRLNFRWPPSRLTLSIALQRCRGCTVAGR